MDHIKKDLSENKGFLRIIVILIVVLVILSLLGLDPNQIWFSFFRPIFAFIGNIIIVTANWLVTLLRNMFGTVSNL